MSTGRPAALLLLASALLALLLGFYLWHWNLPGHEAPPESELPDAAEEGAPALEGRPADRTAAATPTVETPVATDAGWTIRGIVRDSRGRLVSGARVDVIVRRGEIIERLETVSSDEDGRYEASLEALRAWTPVVRRSGRVIPRGRAPGYMPGGADEVPIVETDGRVQLEVDLELARGCMVEGRVLDERGNPAVHASVSLRRTDGPNKAAPWGGDWGYADTDGRYVLGVPEAGAHRVEATGEGGGWAESGSFDLALQERLLLPDLVLRAGGLIEGRVVDPHGTGIPGLRILGDLVETARGGQMGLSVTSGERGLFRMAVPKQGRYLVRLGDSFAGTIEAECEAGARDVELVVDAPRLVVRIVDPTGKPLPGTTFVAMGWRKQDARHLDAALEGRVSMDVARNEAYSSMAGQVSGAEAIETMFVHPESVWLLSAHLEGAAPAEVAVRMQPEQQVAEVKLVVGEARPTGRLDLELIGSDGKPVRRFAVGVETVAGSTLADVLCDEQGKLPPVPSGRVRVRVAPEAGESWLEREYGYGTLYLPEEHILEIPAGGALKKRLPLRLGGRFRLQITYPEGERPEEDDLRVTLRPRDDPDAPMRYAGMWVDERDGKILITSSFRPDVPRLNIQILEPADYVLEIRTRLHGTHERNLRILPGEITDVVIDASQGGASDK